MNYYVKNKCHGVYKICFTPKTGTTPTTQPATTSVEEPECIKRFIYHDTEDHFDGEITSFKLLKEIKTGHQSHSHGGFGHGVHSFGHGGFGSHGGFGFGHHGSHSVFGHKCTEGLNYIFSGTHIIVRNCPGVYEICFVPPSPPTTAPATTQTTDECVKLVAKHGLRKELPGEITTVELLNNIEENQGHGHGGYGYHKPHHCEKWTHYFFFESLFTVTPDCKAIFKVCYVPGTDQATTVPPPEPTCKKELVSFHHHVAKVEGTITSVSLLKSVKRKHGGHHGGFAGSHFNHLNKGHGHQEFEHEKCVRGVDYFFERDTFFAPGCHGLYEICFEPIVPVVGTSPATTVVPTTTKPEKCKEVSHSYDFEGKIISAVILRQDRPHPIHHKHKGFHHPPTCEEHLDYFFQGNSFTVVPTCKAYFKVCYEEPGITATASTPPPPEPEVDCVKIPIKRHTKKDFPGTITSVEVLDIHKKGHGHYDTCKEDKDYVVNANQLESVTCDGFFKICYIPPLTTPTVQTASTTNPNQCTTVFSHHGLKRVFDGEVTSATLIFEKKPVHSAHRFGRSVHHFQSQHHSFGYGHMKPSCIEGHDYFFEGTEFFVLPHCSGKFEVCYGNKPSVTQAPATTEEPADCKRVVASGHPLVREYEQEISDVTLVLQGKKTKGVVSKCIQDVTYRFEGNTFSVDSECIGVFRVCFAPPADAATTQAPVEPMCYKVKAQGHLREEYHGEIQSVKLLHHHGHPLIGFAHGHCKEGVQYFYKDSVFTVEGCHAVFRVCVVPPVTSEPAAATTTPPKTCEKTHILHGSSKTFDRPISSVELIYQLKTHPGFGHHGHQFHHEDPVVCREGEGFKIRSNVLTVDGKCYGIYEVCFE